MLDKDMDEILQQGIQDLGFQPVDPKRQRLISKFPWDPTPNNDIVGDVEHEKLKLVSMLTDTQSTSHVTIIVGCGGSGKTTLARRVFDDHQTRNAFSTLLWVRGSKDFKDVELLSAIACCWP
jgi:type II secretory pathway predicted ATPase ExeA